MPDSPTPETESAFVCDCDRWGRSACAGEPFYKEQEGKRYCILHFPGKDKGAYFQRALQRKLDNKDFNFRGVWFPDEMRFAGFAFTGNADFNWATFRAKADFISATFSAEVFFSRATFSAPADFRSANFSAAADFSRVRFSAEANFSNTNFS